MESLRIANLPPLPPDPSNAVADDPRAARFGHRLFFDPRLSGNGEFAFSSCHRPERRFTGGRLIGAALGESKRNTPSIVGKARCIECHNGPLRTNNEFHNTGIISAAGKIPDRGRIDGIRLVRDDPFNCLGAYSDDPVKDCAELRFARTGAEVVGALRTPSLRNLQGTAPYSHQGQTPSLERMMLHYDRAPLAMIGHNEANPLGLSRRERAQLAAFLATLDAPPATAPQWLAPPAESVAGTRSPATP